MGVSVDGYFEGPDSDISWHMVDDELHGHMNEQIGAMSALLMGRVNFQLMDSFWPTFDSDPSVTGPMAEFAGIWREMPKIVFSRTLEEVDDPKATIRHEIDVEEMTALKAEPGGDMVVGGADLGAAFRRLDLIDEYRIYVHPVLVGRGRRLFEESDTMTGLRLDGTRTFGNGVVMLRYERAAASDEQ
jgi:dihydrofolate reductase